MPGDDVMDSILEYVLSGVCGFVLLRPFVPGCLRPIDDRLVPDLLRGRGRSIGGDLDVDDEGSEQNFEPLQSLHHYSVV
jgi:hypothetical protein